MDTKEFEDYLELRSTEIREHIRTSHKQYLAGQARPAETFLANIKKRKRLRSRTARRRKA